MIRFNKKKLLLFSEELLNVANQSIKVRSSLKAFGTKPESFNDYIRNLIVEDWKKNKKILENIK